MGMSRPAVGDQLDEGRTLAAASAVGRPSDPRGDLVRIVAEERHTRNTVADSLEGKPLDQRLLADVSAQGPVIVFHDEDHVEALHGGEIDRLVPLSQARAAFADEGEADPVLPTELEGIGHAEQGLRGDRQRRSRRHDPALEVADVKVATAHWRALLAVLHQDRQQRLGQEHQHGSQVADQRADVVAAVGLALPVLGVAAQPERGAHDGLLTGGAETLLGRGIAAPADLFTVERLLQEVVHRPGEEHGAKHQPTLLRGEGGVDPPPLEEASDLDLQGLTGPGDHLLVGDEGVELLRGELRAGTGTGLDAPEKRLFQLRLRGDPRKVTNQKRGLEAEEAVQLPQEVRGQRPPRLRPGLGHERPSIRWGLVLARTIHDRASRLRKAPVRSGRT